MLGSPILYLKGMRILMFQLSGFYYRVFLATGGGEDVGLTPKTFPKWSPAANRMAYDAMLIWRR